jgi:hypothetical protein
MRLQKIGGLAALGLSIQFLVSLVFFVFVLPRLGLTTFDDLGNPAKGMVAMAASPGPFFVLNLINASFGVTTVLIGLGLYERFQDTSVDMRLVAIAAAIASAFFLAWGLVPIATLPAVVAANDASAYRAVNAVAGGLALTGVFAAGWILVLSGFAGLRVGRLSRPLAFFLIAGGIVEILEFAIPLFLLLDPLVGVAWGLWLGIELLRTPAAARQFATG